MVTESQTKLCVLDPIPTFLLKECIDILLPFLTAMIIASLRDDSLPASQKRAIVSPLLKKPSLEPSEMRNYRSASNLTFVSKVVERVIASQLTRYLQSHDLMLQDAVSLPEVTLHRDGATSCPVRHLCSSR